MSLCIIPARGGSKRIPRKNIRNFRGQPMIAWSIQAAQKSGCFERIVVSTDDEEIASISLSFGAEVPFKRPPRLADDYSGTREVVVHAIDALEDGICVGEDVCCMYATAPFVTEKLLTKTYNIFKKRQYDSLFPAIKYSFPIQRAIKIDNSGKMKMFYPEHISTRTQDLPIAYHDSGQFYWVKAPTILKEKKLWTDNTGILILSELESHDIDTLEDWKIAELKYRILNKINV